MGDMLLRDAKPDGFESGCLFVFFVKSFSGRLIPATVNVNRLATYRPHFKAGSIDTTRFDVLTDTVTPIPQEHFRFHNYSELLASSCRRLGEPRREARSKLGFSPRGPEARLIHEGACLFTPCKLQASRLFTPQRFLNL
ncbi:hypothetical protein HID58_054694, partial [Brassica napus]